MSAQPMLSTKTPAERRPELDSITGLRFFAAFFVVVYHYAPALFAHSPSAVRNLVASGYTAVGLFFVLSGFVLSYRYLEQGGFRGTKRAFWVARLARIYPAYLAGFLLAAPFVIGASLAVNSLSAAAAKLSVNAVLALALLQSWTPFTAWYWNTPGWSLSTEVFFYFCFPLAAPLVCRLGRVQALIAIALLYIAAIAGPAALIWISQTAQAPPLPIPQLAIEVNPLFRLPEFLIGVLLGRVYLLRDRTRHPANQWLAPLGLAVVLIVLCAAPAIPRPLLSGGLLAPATALLIYGLADGTSLLEPLLSNPVIVRLGEASYSIYILQWPIAHALGVESGATSWLSFSSFAAALIVISLLCLKWAEIPARKAILSASRKSGRTAQEYLTGTPVAVQPAAGVVP